MVPKKAYFFWAGKSLPWMRYLTLASFCKFNPSFEVFLFTATEFREDCMVWQASRQTDASESLLDYSYKIKELPINIVQYSNTDVPNTSPVHISDIFSWDILSTRGGLYFDMDILFVRSLDDIFLEVCGSDILVSHFAGCYSIGFMGSSGNNRYFRDVYTAAILHHNIQEYQSSGNISQSIVAKTVPDIRRKYPEYKVVNLLPEIVYPITDLTYIYKTLTIHLNANAVGLHWYGGHPWSQTFSSSVNHTNIKDANNTLSYHINRIGIE